MHIWAYACEFVVGWMVSLFYSVSTLKIVNFKRFNLAQLHSLVLFDQ